MKSMKIMSAHILRDGLAPGSKKTSCPRDCQCLIKAMENLNIALSLTKTFLGVGFILYSNKQTRQNTFWQLHYMPWLLLSYHQSTPNEYILKQLQSQHT